MRPRKLIDNGILDTRNRGAIRTYVYIQRVNAAQQASLLKLA